MNAGKSTYLLQVAHNYKEHGKTVFLMTFEMDNRMGHGKISSRLGISSDAATFNENTDFEKLLAELKVNCVLIDEAQFLTFEQVRALHKWAHAANTPVMCFGLRSDFQGKSFPGSAALLTLADDLEEIRTVCACGKRATMNLRTNLDGERLTEGSQVQIGGNDTYRQVCAKCFYS